MSLFMKFDIDPDDLPETRNLPWMEKEARRRCWWFCYHVDGAFSALSNQPPMLHQYSKSPEGIAVKGVCHEDEWSFMTDYSSADGGDGDADDEDGHYNSGHGDAKNGAAGNLKMKEVKVDVDPTSPKDSPVNHFLKLGDIFKDILIYNMETLKDKQVSQGGPTAPTASSSSVIGNDNKSGAQSASPKDGVTNHHHL
jgi:hypothetical protein